MKYFNARLNALSSKAIILLLSTGLIIGNGIAQEPNPIPTTYTDLPVPQLTGWNMDNIITLDAITSATAKSNVYESVAAKETADDGGDKDVGKVASVFWELDNGSGRAPGIQVVTDDLDVPTNNCIMASGELESVDFPGTIVPKTCSDPEGSSKRYFLKITESDVPVDLAFDLGIKDIRYGGVKDPETDGGVALAEFKATYGIGRIYRVIQKVVNITDERIANYKFELGTGIGDSFLPLTFEEHGVAFEMRTLVPREFFEGETGAPDISVWDPLRFATVSPKMYDDGLRARFEPGFLDHAAAGFLPPQIPAEGVEKSQLIDSGTTIVDGIIGSLTPNYFDIPNNQGSTATLPGNLLGYQLPESLIPTVIAEYNTNEIGGESDAIVAIWDGFDWRSGRAGLDGLPGLDDLDPDAADNFGVIPEAQLQQWAAKPLGLNIPGEDPADLVRYESELSDDLRGLNTDFFIYIGDKLLDDTGALTLDSITLRVTANSVVAVIGTAAGDEEPEWMKAGQEPPTLASYTVASGIPVAINDITTTVQDDPSDTITIDVLANDLLDGAPVDPALGTIAITAGPADGIASIIDPGLGDEKIAYTPDADFVGTDYISYTYTRTDGGLEVSNVATIKIIVDAAPIPDQPLAVNDSAVTFKDIPVTLDVLVNDELYNDAPNTVVVSINNDALNGVASVAGDNTILYTPDADFVGFERFTYVVTVDGIVSNSALVTIKVDSFGIPDAINDITVTLENFPVTIDVLENDVLEGAPVIPADGFITITKPPQNGSAAIVDQKVVYTPDAGFSGTDLISYTYTLTSTGDVSNTAIVTIIVDATPSPGQPLTTDDSATTIKNTAVTVDVLGNDDLNNNAPSTVVISINNKALHGVASVASDNTIVYTPGVEFLGIERFTYVVTVDGIVSNSTLVTISVEEKEDKKSGGCSVGSANAPFDPILPGMVLFAAVGLFMRRRKSSIKI